MKLPVRDRSALVEAALGKRPMDLVIRNVNMVNVFTGEIYPAKIGIYDGFIAHIEADPDGFIRVDVESYTPMEGKEEFDGGGMYIIPGLIDTHVHIESSMMTPANFARTVIPQGTTTIITDPHEIGNVLGVEGVRYMLEASEDLPMRQYILVPSCVPSAPGLETAGAVFGPEEVARMMEWERVLGLAEVMDFPGVIYGNERMKQILKVALERDGFIQGHSPTLRGRALSAYLCAGPRSDHEITVAAEAREKIRLGMTVDARESSISQNLKELIPAIRDFCHPMNFTLCTDDREPDDLLHQGHMNYVVRRAIEEGLEPVDAIRCATLHAAQSIGLENLGAVAPGYAADLVILPSLSEMKPSYVFFQGRLVAEKGKLTVDIPSKEFPLEKENTIRISPLKPEDFRIAAPISEGKIPTRVISYITEDSLYTEFNIEELQVRDGFLDISNAEGLNYVAVFQRHGSTGNRSIGVVGNFGLTEGAIASTVSHDCHNLTVVASNPQDAALAANTLIECGGGLACAQYGKVIAILPLPIAGLMSPLSCEQLAVQTSNMKKALKNLGIPGENPLLRIATLTLAVIPKAKITDMGLVSVIEQEFVSLFPEAL